MPNSKTISFRSQLRGDVADFLEAASMVCADTAGALVQLLVALSHYTEEGEDLYPKVIVCDDKSLTLRLLQGRDPIAIGGGPRNADTVAQALKKCAPLARGGWSIFVERTPDRFDFGVFREPTSPTALDLRDTITQLDAEDAKIVFAQQLARSAVELVRPGGNYLQVHLSAARADQDSPVDALVRLCNAAVHDLEEGSQEPASSFLRTTMSNALRGGHGALIAIAPSGDAVPEKLAGDCVVMSPPVDLGGHVAKHGKPNAETLGTLLAYAGLLSGMLSSDGITILSADCKVLGYNAFVQDPRPTDAAPREFVGGARRRAYSVLSSLVDSGELRAAYFRSSDGGAGCLEAPNE